MYIWKTSIVDLYNEQIEHGNNDFFLNKDYKNDIPVDSDNKLIEIIEDIKSLLLSTTTENKDKAMKYVQNLTKLCKLYYNQ